MRQHAFNVRSQGAASTTGRQLPRTAETFANTIGKRNAELKQQLRAFAGNSLLPMAAAETCPTHQQRSARLDVSAVAAPFKENAVYANGKVAKASIFLFSYIGVKVKRENFLSRHFSTAFLLHNTVEEQK